MKTFAAAILALMCASPVAFGQFRSGPPSRPGPGGPGINAPRPGGPQIGPRAGGPIGPGGPIVRPGNGPGPRGPINTPLPGPRR